MNTNKQNKQKKINKQEEITDFDERDFSMPTDGKFRIGSTILNVTSKLEHRMNKLAMTTDWKINPIGWINELYQDPELLTELGLQAQYTLLFDVKMDAVHTFKVTMTWTCNNIKASISKIGDIRKEVEKEVALSFCKRFAPSTFADAQMDSTESTEQGMSNAVSEVKENTILVRSVPTQLNEGISDTGMPSLGEFSSSQEKAEFNILLNRWLQIDHFTLGKTDTFNQKVKRWSLPSFFYNNTTMPNQLPFHQFVFMQPNIRLKLRVNSHKFAQGKYVMSYIYDASSINDGDQLTHVRGALSRPHVLLDLNDSNEVEIEIPFKAKSSYILTVPDADNIETANLADVFLHCISPYNAPDEAPTTIPCTLFISFFNTKFTGMRYYKPLTADAQMGMEMSKDIMAGIRSTPILGSLAGAAASTMGHLALAIQRPFRNDETMQAIEKNFKYVGIINNRDKPADIKQPLEFRPNVAGNLGTGVGVEPLMPLRLDPTATTIHLPEHQTTNSPKSIKDIIQIWGYHKSFTWAMSQATETKLWSEEAWPTDHTELNNSVSHTAVPLANFGNFYMYYTGSIEYRFDFVCTQFHTGTVIIAWMPYNSEYTYSQSRATYFKVFDLREQHSVTFTVPYINNTVVRLLPYTSAIPAQGLEIQSPGLISVWVVNPLTPIQSVTSQIEVLIYKRAGPDFQYSYLRQATLGSPGKASYGYGVLPTTLTADAQMETGDKENIDQTDNFKQILPVTARVQVNEDHMLIKDILRRWIVVQDATLAPCTIPIVPFNFYSNQNVNNTLQAYLFSNFRWSRGGLCVMLTASTGVYRVTHIPQGLYMPETRRGMATNSLPILTGLAHTLWDTSINKTLKLEIPFHGVFNYLDNGATNPKTYDKIARNLGFLFVELHSGVADNIIPYIRVADDFELYEFIYQPYRYNTDIQAVAQMDHETILLSGDIEQNPGPVGEITSGFMTTYTQPLIHPLDFGTKVWGGVKNISSNTVKPLISMKEAMVNSPVAIKSLQLASDSWKNAGDQANEMLEYLKELALTITDKIKNSCSWVTSAAGIFNSVLHFLHMIITPTWSTFCVSIAGIFASIGNIFSNIGTKILDFFLQLKNRAPIELPTGGANAQMDEVEFTSEDKKNLCGLIFGTVSGYLGYKGTNPSFSVWTRLLNMNTGFWRTVQGATKFLDGFFILFKKCFNWIVLRVPIARNYFTLYSENDEIVNFVEEAQTCLNEVNLAACIDDPAFKHKFWCTVVRAYKLQQQLIVKPEKNTQPLLRLIQKLIDKSNELAISLTSSPVRYEPYVLSLEGGTKIGKSYLTQRLVPGLLSEGFGVSTSGNPIFVRTPGVEFWNGYRDQKAIIYDDFLAHVDPAIAVPQVIEIYNLKSTALMNMNMADLNSKSIRGNPNLVVLLRNHGNTVLNGTIDPKSFHRRCDSKWKAEMKKEYEKKNVADLPDDVKNNFTHLNFFRFRDVTDSTSLNRLKPFSYKQYRAILIKEMREYHEREKVNMAQRAQSLVETLPEEIRKYMTNLDPFSIFHAIYSDTVNKGPIQTGWLPSHILEEQTKINQNIARLLAEARQVQQRLTPNPVIQPPVIQPTMNYDEPRNSHNYPPEFETQWMSEENFLKRMERLNRSPQEEVDYATDVFDVWENLRSSTNATVNADPQFNLNDVTVFGQSINSIIKKMFMIPIYNPNNTEHRRINRKVECNTCYAEVVPFAGCGASNLHVVCINCYDQMQLRGPVVCPMCRHHEFLPLRDAGETFIERFRPFVMGTKVYDALRYNIYEVYEDPRQACHDFCTWWRRSPTAMYCTGALMIGLYAALMTHITGMDQRAGYDRIHPIASQLGIAHWKPEKSVGWMGYLGLNDWKVALSTVPHQVSNGEVFRQIVVDKPTGLGLVGRFNVPNFIGVANTAPIPAFVQNMFDDYGPQYGRDSITELTIESGLQPEALYDLSEICADPQFDIEDLPLEQRSPLIKRVIPYNSSTQIQGTGHGSCPHLYLAGAMNRRLLTDVSYEVNQETNEWGWYIDSEVQADLWMSDYPCQYQTCYFKQDHQRQLFLHSWAKSRNATILRQQSYFHDGQDWPLPKEFMDAPTAIHIDIQRTRMINQIRDFGRVHWTEKAGGVFREVWKFTKVAIQLTLALQTVLKVFNFAKWLAGKAFNPKVEANLISSGSMHTTKLSRTNRLPRVAQPVIAHANESQVDSAIQKIQKNAFFIQCTFKEGTIVKNVNMRGLGLFSRIGLIPGHYGKYMINANKRSERKEISELKFVIYSFLYKDIQIPFIPGTENLAYTDSEHCYFSTPPQFPLFKDLTNLIPTLQEHESVGATYWHIEPSPVTGTVIQCEGTIRGTIDTITINGTQSFEPYKIFDVYASSYGRTGSCGAAYIGSTTKPIFAMHVAGNATAFSTTGYGIPLIKEDIDKLKTNSAVLSYFIPKVADAQIALPGYIIPITTIAKKDKPMLPTKSKIKPSLICSEFDRPPITAPAILSTKDDRWKWEKSPLYWGCIKHTEPPKSFNTRILEMSFRQCEEIFLQNVKPLRIVEPITYEQAITGFKDLEFYDAMDMSTSVGWPWNIGERKRKTDYVSFIQDPSGFMKDIKIDDDLMRVMDMKQTLRERGIRPYTVFLDWLKDERRKENKINRADGTRIFSLSPIDFTIQLRQSTLDFSAAMMAAKLEIPSCVGVSPDGPEWSRLANKLNNFSPNIITFDYSDFGPRLPADVGKQAIEIIIRWYEQHVNEELGKYMRQQLSVMGEELFSSYHLMNDFIYQVLCGSPSGACTTVIINTLVNILMLLYIWKYIILTSGIDPTFLDKFFDYVLMFLYGDDGIMSVKSEVLDWFNLKTIMKAFDEHDIIITDAEKKTARLRGEPIPNLDSLPLKQTLQESTVLKRGFKQHPTRDNHWLAPLDEISVEEACRWIWKSPDDKLATIQNCEQSVLLSYGHGPKYFNQWKKLVNKKLSNLNLALVNRSWDEIDQQFFGVSPILGTFEPLSWSGGSSGYRPERVKDSSKSSTGVAIEYLGMDGKATGRGENCGSNLSNSRQCDSDGLKARIIRCVDRDLKIFDDVSGGILPTALNLEDRTQNFSLRPVSTTIPAGLVI